MDGDVVLETWREYMRVVIDGLADDLGPELTRRAIKTHGITVPGDAEDDE